MYYVYFLRCERFIKIGIAQDVEIRRACLDAMSPFPITTEKIIEVNSRSEARKFERKLHTRYKRYQIKGEWFKDIVLELDSEFRMKNLKV